VVRPERGGQFGRPMIARGFAKEDIMAAKFAINKKPGGQYDLVLKAANGEIIATSENYTTKNGSVTLSAPANAETMGKSSDALRAVARAVGTRVAGAWTT